PAEAIAAFQARGALEPTFSWQDMWEEEHARAFTVAKSTGFDVLTDIYGALQQALSEGETFESFSKKLRPTLQAKGCWGQQAVVDRLPGQTVKAQLASPRRLRTIFDTNMRVSYAAGHWAQFERTKAARPWLRFLHRTIEHPRPAHVARNNM